MPDSPTFDLPDDPEFRAAVALSRVAGIGPRLYTALYEHFGSASAALQAGPAELCQVPGVGPKLARQVVMTQTDELWSQLQTLCRTHRIRIWQRGQTDYPRLLSEIPDPPTQLFWQGTWEPGDEMAIAIVGSRHASQYGLKIAESLARGLSLAGLTIISGLARGIDQAAHRGALAAGGRTLAILGGGVLRVYPPEHQELAQQIQGQGAVISEAWPSEEPRGLLFPARNRIISGLSLGVVVVEAAERSGALISARLAGEQGREVMAVPGRVDNRLAQGCHRLIRDGAKLVQTADDVLEELGPLVRPLAKSTTQTIHHPAELKLNERETQVLQAVGVESTLVDEIVAKTQIPVHHVLATLHVLEMRRLVKRLGGTAFIRV